MTERPGHSSMRSGTRVQPRRSYIERARVFRSSTQSSAREKRRPGPVLPRRAAPSRSRGPSAREAHGAGAAPRRRRYRPPGIQPRYRRPHRRAPRRRRFSVAPPGSRSHPGWSSSSVGGGASGGKIPAYAGTTVSRCTRVAATRSRSVASRMRAPRRASGLVPLKTAVRSGRAASRARVDQQCA